MRTLLLPLFSLLTGNRLVLQAMSCVMAEWIDTGLSELKASVVSHGFFWMRLTYPPGVAVAGHAEWPPATREMVVRGLTTRRNPRRIPRLSIGRTGERSCCTKSSARRAVCSMGLRCGNTKTNEVRSVYIALAPGGTSARFARDVLADEGTERACAALASTRPRPDSRLERATSTTRYGRSSRGTSAGRENWPG